MCAAALADNAGAGIGSLLSHVKYADGTQHKLFESGSANLAHWLDGKCPACSGSGNTTDRRIYLPCKGGGRGEISEAGGFELEKIKDMLSELEGILQSHNARGASLTREAYS